MRKEEKIKTIKNPFLAIKENNRGITLIALVVTIIVILILVGISIATITGENGIIANANKAKIESEIAGYKEKLKVIGAGLGVEKEIDKLTNKEYMDRYEEEIKKDNTFKEATVTRKDEETIKVVTDEGYVYEVTKDGVEYIGKEGENLPPDLEESDIEFTITPSAPTNQSVKVSITTKIEGYELQYSINGTTWNNYSTEITITDNGPVYARLINNLDEAGGYATGNILNIDRLAPNTFIPTVASTTNSITLTGSTTDKAKTETDGCSGIDKYYFSKDDGETWEPSAGQTGTSYTFNNLTQNKIYQLKMKAVDKAGNETITNTVSKNTGTVAGLDSSNVTFTYTPSTPTKRSVKVEIETIVSGYTLQYSTDGSTWNNYTTAITVTDNGVIYARLFDGTNAGGYATGNILNIDRIAPNAFTPTVTSTTNSITLTGSTTDKAKTETDGCSGIDKYYFSKDNGATWEPSAGQTGTSYTFNNLTQNKIYQLKMKAVDKAGNETITNTVSKNTGTVAGLDSSNVTFTYNPSAWTNGNVAVSISTTVTGYTLQYSTNGSTWTNYTSSITMSSNGVVYARVVDSSGQAGGYATGNITNIDRTLPTIDNIVTSEPTQTSVKLEVTAHDENGINTYKYYLNGNLKAESSTNSYTYTGLSSGQENELKVYVVDKAGNATEKAKTIKLVTVTYDANGGIVDRASETGIAYLNDAGEWVGAKFDYPTLEPPNGYQLKTDSEYIWIEKGPKSYDYPTNVTTNINLKASYDPAKYRYIPLDNGGQLTLEYVCPGPRHWSSSGKGGLNERIATYVTVGLSDTFSIIIEGRYIKVETEKTGLKLKSDPGEPYNFSAHTYEGFTNVYEDSLFTRVIPISYDWERYNICRGV